MTLERPDIEVIMEFPGAYSLARVRWAAGRVTFQETVGEGANALTMTAAMHVPLPGSLISSCWTESSSLGGPGWVHTYEAA